MLTKISGKTLLSLTVFIIRIFYWNKDSPLYLTLAVTIITNTAPSHMNCISIMFVCPSVPSTILLSNWNDFACQVICNFEHFLFLTKSFQSWGRRLFQIWLIWKYHFKNTLNYVLRFSRMPHTICSRSKPRKGRSFGRMGSHSSGKCWELYGRAHTWFQCIQPEINLSHKA